MLSFYLIFLGLGILLAITFFNLPAREVISVLENMDYRGHTPMLKMMQIFYSVGLFLMPSLLGSFLIGGKTWAYLSACRIPGPHIVLLMVMLMFSVIPLINYTSVLNEKLVLPEKWNGLMERIIENDESQWNMMKAFLDTKGFGGILFSLLMIALVPAIGEEFLFRGILQKIFSEWFGSMQAAIWITALLFSLMHYQFMGFIPRILLGALFGYLFIWTGSIWVPVLAHFLNNGMAVIWYTLYFRGNVMQNPDHIGVENNTALMIGFSAVISVLVLLIIRRLGKDSTDSQLL